MRSRVNEERATLGEITSGVALADGLEKRMRLVIFLENAVAALPNWTFTPTVDDSEHT